METGHIRDFKLSSRIAEELELILCSASDARLATLSVAYVRAVSGHRFEVGLVPCGDDAERDIVEALSTKAETFLRAELVSALNVKRAPSFQFVLLPEDVIYED